MNTVHVVVLLQDENVAISGLQSSLENTRGHLQKQLRTKEADCNRMAVQIRVIYAIFTYLPREPDLKTKTHKHYELDMINIHTG